MNEITHCKLKRNALTVSCVLHEKELWQTHTSLTATRQVSEVAKNVLRHKQTSFSSPRMPLKGSVKMTSLPWIVRLPCRSLTHLVWVIPISWWLPIRTLTRPVWAPFSPSRRWGWSSPVQDHCFHLTESQSSSLFFKVFCFLASSILSTLAFNFSDDLPR